MSMRISLKKFFVYSLLGVLVFESAVRYSGLKWESTQFGNVVSMVGRTIPLYKYIELLCIVCLFFLSLRTVRIQKNILTYSGLLLGAVSIFWCIVNSDLGAGLIYLDTTPVLLLELSLIFFVGQDEKILELFIRTIPLLACIFSILTMIETIDFVSQYQLIRMANGKVIEHFANALFLTSCWNCIKRNTKIDNLMIYIISGVLMVCSIVITSRGWMLQAIMLFVLAYLTTSKRKAFDKAKRVFFMVVIFAILYSVISKYMSGALDYIIGRFGQNTRENQLVTFFEQVPFWKLFVGQGYNAAYHLNGVNYAYIDNIFLFWMFRYGIFSVVGYWLPFLYVVFNKNRNLIETKMRYIGTVFAWILAMGGLCIYYLIKLDAANIMLIMIVCHYVQKGKRIILSKKYK